MNYIVTDRLILRGWNDADRPVFAEINGNDRVMRYFPSVLSPEESNSLADRIISELNACNYGLFAVEEKESGEFIGFVGLHRFNFEASFSPGLEIGWRLSDKFWGRGYATEAASACIEYAKRHMLTERLYAFTSVHNTPSENVMKRIGMAKVGHFGHPALPDGHWLKEHVLYAIDL